MFSFKSQQGIPRAMKHLLILAKATLLQNPGFQCLWKVVGIFSQELKHLQWENQALIPPAGRSNSGEKESFDSCSRTEITGHLSDPYLKGKHTMNFSSPFAPVWGVCGCLRSPWWVSWRGQLCLCCWVFVKERKSQILTEQCYDKSRSVLPWQHLELWGILWGLSSAFICPWTCFLSCRWNGQTGFPWNLSARAHMASLALGWGCRGGLSSGLAARY